MEDKVTFEARDMILRCLTEDADDDIWEEERDFADARWDEPKNYLPRYPAPGELPDGVIFVHNQVIPALQAGQRGSRFWTDPAGTARREPCPCHLVPDHLIGNHYRVIFGDEEPT